jgi:hypothetical protein
MPHLGEVRSSKAPFQLTTILSFAKQIAASTVAKDMKPGVTAWHAIGESIAQLVQEGSKLLPLTLEADNVIKGTCARTPSFALGANGVDSLGRIAVGDESGRGQGQRGG